MLFHFVFIAAVLHCCCTGLLPSRQIHTDQNCCGRELRGYIMAVKIYIPQEQTRSVMNVFYCQVLSLKQAKAFYKEFISCLNQCVFIVLSFWVYFCKIQHFSFRLSIEDPAFSFMLPFSVVACSVVLAWQQIFLFIIWTCLL